MLNTLTQLVATYGYLVVGLFIVLESAGVPLPAETVLLVAAAAAGAGHLRLGILIAVAAGAAIVGDAGGYWLGRRGGRAFLERYGQWLHLDPQKLDRLETFFARHGPKAVFFGRFVGILRTYAALFAGISRMPYGTFTLFNALGGVLWASLFGFLGYVFGQNLAMVEQVVRDFGWALLGVVLLLGLVVFLWRWLATHQTLLIEQRNWLLANPLIARVRVRYRRQLLWLRARLTPGEYLGLHVTIGLIVSIGCLWLFGGLVEDIINRDPLVRFDMAVATTLHGWATPLATTIFVLITDLGSPVVIVLALVVTGVYAWRRQWLRVGTWLIALGGGEVLNVFLKYLFARPRPVFVDPLLVETSYSFPSGHAMGSLIVYGMLAYFGVLVVKSWRARTAIICGTSLLILLIGFSRLYLGVHYFSDVIAGFAAAGVWLSTCITGMELVRRGELSERWKQRIEQWGRRQPVM